jgi:transcriptional regulator with XRE-family HTH domain
MVIDLETYRQKKKGKLPRLFREYIRACRQNQGDSQEKIALETCLDRSSISRMESGAMPIHKEDAVVLCRALNRPDLLDIYCRECTVYQERVGSLPKPAA